ncbi:MAG TPA: hypothetical protein VIJ87_16060, partial [Pyrinomonadaceae bacterium]
MQQSGSALTAASTFSATGQATFASTVALTGASTMLITFTGQAFGSADLTAQSSLTAVPFVQRLASTSVSGASTLVAAGLRTATGSATLSGATTLTVNGTRIQSTSVSMSGQTSITAQGTGLKFGQLTMSGMGNASGTPVRLVTAQAGFDAATVFSTASTRITHGSAALVGDSEAIAIGASEYYGILSLTGESDYIVAVALMPPLASKGTLFLRRTPIIVEVIDKSGSLFQRIDTSQVLSVNYEGLIHTTQITEFLGPNLYGESTVLNLTQTQANLVYSSTEIYFSPVDLYKQVITNNDELIAAFDDEQVISVPHEVRRGYEDGDFQEELELENDQLYLV